MPLNKETVETEMVKSSQLFTTQKYIHFQSYHPQTAQNPSFTPYYVEFVPSSLKKNSEKLGKIKNTRGNIQQH